jgi:hypothetical protein
LTTEILHHALNVGVVDDVNLHRIDLQRMRLAAEDQTNIVPNSVGRGQFRAGFEYLTGVQSNNEGRLFPFIAGNSDAYLLELTNGKMRVVDGATDELITRPSVTCTVATGDFSADASWTKATTSGQTTTISGGQLRLTARARGGKAIAKQQVATSTPNVIHALAIDVDRGPVTFRVGSTDGGDEYVTETVLRTGTHSIAFLPTGSFWVQFSVSGPSPLKLVNSCQIEAAGVMVLDTNWTLADIEVIKTTQSLDVMFVASMGKKQQRIERRGDGSVLGQSWSVVDYDSNDGPFTAGPTADVKLTPSACEGNITLTASEGFFKSTHVGALFKIFHNGQRIDTYLVGNESYTPTFMVTGVTEVNFEERKYSYTIAGTWVGTLRNYRSFDGEDVEFHQFRRAQTVATIDITANASYTNDDNDDNAITWVKIGFGASTYTSGEAQVTITYEGGGGYGIGRITAVTNSTTAEMEVLRPFLGITASGDWQEGVWSDRQGWPNGVALHSGRLVWVGNDGVWASISDAYESYDEEFEGDAGPLLRAIALGGRNEGRWLMSLATLMVGCDARVATIRASSLDEILTPTNFDLKHIDKVPCSSVTPVELKNDRGLFVSDGDAHLYELNYLPEAARYVASKFSLLTDQLFATGITGLSTQSFPDQRVWVTCTDAPAVNILHEPLLEIVAAVPIETTSGDIVESVAVLPGVPHDRVYAIVKRTVNGSTVRYIEKQALESEAVPGDICKCVDSHVTFGAGSATISGLSHLIGRTVVVWMDGDAVNDAGTTDTKEFTVNGSGEITLPSVPTIGGCVGVPYRGRFKSARLAYGSGGESPFLKNKTLSRVGLILGDVVRSGVKFGGEFDNADHPLTSLPELDARGTTADDVIAGVMPDEAPFALDGENGFDARLCIEFNSPKPASILAIVMAIDT